MFPPIHPDDLPSLAALGVGTAGFITLHYAARAEILAQRHKISQSASVHWQRIAGAVLLGVFPMAALKLGFHAPWSSLGLGAPDLRKTLAFLVAVSVVVLPVVWRAQSRPEAWGDAPQIRKGVFTPGDLALNALTWAIYLVGYELLFRGVLLFTLSGRVGPWMAVGVTTSVYVLAHLPKPTAETVGTLPMGVVFALSALTTGSFWAPMLAHLMIAVSSDLSAMRSNPEITVKLR